MTDNDMMTARQVVAHIMWVKRCTRTEAEAELLMALQSGRLRGYVAPDLDRYVEFAPPPEPGGRLPGEEI